MSLLSPSQHRRRDMAARREPRRASAFAPALVFLLAPCVVAGCGAGTDHGEVTVLLQAEDTITLGLDAGSGRENIVDGWTVRFDKYLVAVGNVKLGRDVHHIEVHDPTRRVYDLTRIPQSDWQLTMLTGVEAKRYDFFGYEVVGADVAERHESVTPPDYEAMVDHGASYLIEGFLTRDEEHIGFRLVVPNATQYGPCELDGTPGVAVTGGGTTAVGITFHGDHLFFDSFGSHDVRRRASWLAEADLDASGHVDDEELAAIRGADLAALLPGDRYALGGWTAFPIESAFDFLRAQLHTQGHYQGEGHCVWSVDGTRGGHDDHDHP